jgi:hypothetical protein
MSLETATTISGLVATNPASGDAVSQGDDHLRLLKSVLKAQFPGAAAGGYAIPITATEAELNYVHGVTSAIQTQLNGSVPIGGIVMWSGVTAPANWHLCDGTNSTPNLCGRFIMGYAPPSYTVGAIGGSADAVIVSHYHTATSTGSINLTTQADSSDHTHTFTTGGQNSTHTHDYGKVTSGGTTLAAGAGYSVVSSATTAEGVSHTHTGTTNGRGAQHTHPITGSLTVATTVATAGVSATNANLPPYYVLAFIQRYQ